MEKSIKLKKTHPTQATYPSKDSYILKAILLFWISSLICSCTLINLKKEVTTIFCFLGLMQGEYELTIKAEDNEIYIEKHSVVPGKFGNFQVAELKPLG